MTQSFVQSKDLPYLCKNKRAHSPTCESLTHIKIEKNEEKEDEHKKVFKKGDKMSEEELTRRSADFRKGSRKNKHTHEANDKFKKEHKHHEDENDDEKKEEDE